MDDGDGASRPQNACRFAKKIHRAFAVKNIE
jgi:hypothetical protein